MIVPMTKSEYQKIFNENDFSYIGGEELVPARKKALSSLISNGFPSNKNEDWKYSANKLSKAIEISLNPVNTDKGVSIDLEKLPFIENAYNIAFIDGVLDKSSFDESLANKLYELTSLTEYNSIISSFKESSSAFSNLNTAFLMLVLYFI